MALDRVIAILILGVGIVFTVWPISLGNYHIAFPAILLASSLVYLLLRKRLSGNAEPLQFRLGNRIRLLSHIIFVVSLSISIWLLWSNLYYRPPVYFILCLAAAGSIIFDIFGSDETKSPHTAVVLFKIIALSISIYAGIYYQFPGIYGVDPWWHNQWIQETINLGHITQGQFANNSYFLWPLFQLANATTQIVTSISTYSSIFVTTGVMMAISSCLFVFLTGKKVANAKVGLLAALIVPLTAEAIGRGTAIIAMSLGFCFFSAFLYLILCRDTKRASVTLLFILLSACSILTHTLAALITLLSLLAVFVGIQFYNKVNKPAISHESLSPILIVVFVVAMLGMWLRPAPDDPPFLTSLFWYIVDGLRLSNFIVTAAPDTESSSYVLFLLNRGGYLLLLAFGIIGALTYLHRKKRTAPKVALALIAAALIILPTIFQLFSLKAALPWRWYLFQYVPLSILAVQGLSGISSLIKGSVGKLSMFMLVILAVIFMMTTSGQANTESPLVFNGAERSGYTQAEITAIKSLADMGCGSPMVDIPYNTIFSYVLDYDEYTDMLQGENKVFVYRNYYLHHPEWDQSYVARLYTPTITGSGISPQVTPVLISDYMKEHAIDRCPLIYSNGNVKVYATIEVR